MAIRQTSTITRSFFVRLLSGAALVLAAAPALAGEFAAEIELSTLNGATGFRINGGTASIGAGESVKAAGDVNGDGLADVIIGAPFTANGSAFVVLGAAAGTAIDLDATALNGSNGFRIDGEASGDQLGESVSGAGDVNGDGYDDVIVGATSADVDAGAGYVVFGGPNGSIGSSLALSAMTAGQGFKITVPGPGAEIGRDVSGVGDVNGDGFDDVAVSDNSSDTSFSNAGTIYVIFGGPSPANVNLSSVNAGNGMRIEGPQISASGADSIAEAGDVNGDGIGDMILGIDDVDIPVSNAGASYIVFGGSPPPSTINLSAPDGVSHFRLTGEENSDDSGHSVSGAGDVNGDGYDDVIISAHDASPNGATSTGAAYVVFGRPSFSGSSLNLSVLDGSDGFRLAGEADNDDAGYSVSGAGDVNGDGFDDVVVGARRADTAEVDAGASYVVFGKSGSFASSIDLATLDGTDGFVLNGEIDVEATLGFGSFAGTSVSGAGDVNNDGFGDVLVGAPGADPDGLIQSGAAYVIYGRAPVTSVIRAGSAASQTIQGGAFTDLLWGATGRDVLEGRGSGDILDGSLGADTVSYAHAAAGVIANLAKPSANTGDADGDIYISMADLLGSPHNDTLTGNAAANRITGGKGRDKLKGGKGKDVFAYRLAAESPVGAANRDQIGDFKPGTASKAIDKIDVSAIDAKSAVNGNQAFKFRGTKPFTAAGQLRLKLSGGNVVVQGNTGGSTAPEFEILLKGLTSTSGFSAKDFKL